MGSMPDPQRAVPGARRDRRALSRVPSSRRNHCGWLRLLNTPIRRGGRVPQAGGARRWQACRRISARPLCPRTARRAQNRVAEARREYQAGSPCGCRAQRSSRRHRPARAGRRRSAGRHRRVCARRRAQSERSEHPQGTGHRPDRRRPCRRWVLRADGGAADQPSRRAGPRWHRPAYLDPAAPRKPSRRSIARSS